MPLEQITTEMDVQEPQSKLSKLKAMMKRKAQMAETEAEGRELDRTVASPYQMAMAEKAKAAETEKKKGKLLTPKRTLEVADSLNKEGVKKISLAVDIRNKDKKLLQPSYLNKKDANKISNEGWKDLENSTRYKSLALKAMGKNK